MAQSFSFFVGEKSDSDEAKEVKVDKFGIEDDKARLNCIQSPECVHFKTVLENCHAKMVTIVVPQEHSCDRELFNFINCFEQCMSRGKKQG